MAVPTSIAALDFAPLDLELHEPFGIAGGVQPAANNVLVTITLADGTRGYGEAAPLPPYNGETQADALQALGRIRENVRGRDAAEWRALAVELQPRLRCGSAQCAFETGLLDALTRHRGIALSSYFGDAAAPLETDMTITTGSIEEAASAARAIATRGFRVFKVKIGGKGGAALDLARIAAVHEIAPAARLILDGNAGVTREAAGELVRGLKSRGMAPALLEQWLAKDDLEGMRALREQCGWRVAADESVATVSDARRVIAARAADVFNIKLMKAGIAEALEIVAIARAEGIGLMIGGNVESVLAMTTSACFASGLGGFDFADLDTPLFLASNPFEGGYALEGGRISLSGITAGHGVTLRGSGAE
jgi:L-Ala-D/L-Glu epimerase